MYLDSPGANEVMFASSVDNFRVHETKQESRGVWVVKELTDKEFRYFYMVDGKMFVPNCRYREKDDFGAVNCIYQP